MPIDNTRRARSALKTFFAKNAIPTEDQFAQLIEAGINQRDDGVYKASGDPLSIEAAGDDAGMKRTLAFWSSFSDPNPAWTVALKARRVPADAATARAGWSVLDSGGNARLTIDANTGSVGVGTVQPRERLEVDGRVRAGSLTIGNWAPDGNYGSVGTAGMDQAKPEHYALLQRTDGVTFLNSVGSLYLRIRNDDRVVISDAEVVLNRPLRVVGTAIGPWPVNPAYHFVGLAGLDQRNDANYALLVGDAAERGVTFLNSPTKVNIRIGNGDRLVLEDRQFTVATPILAREALTVQGPIVPSVGADERSGIMFPPDPAGGSGDRAFIRYYSRNPKSDRIELAEQMTLEIGIANDGNDHLLLSPSGNVGIGNPDPKDKLDVAGRIRAGALAMGEWQPDRDFGFLGAHALDQTKTGNYALRQSGAGAAKGWTLLNSPTRVAVRINDADRMLVDDKLLTVTTPLTAKDGLTVEGPLVPSAGGSERSGIIFPPDPGGGGGDRAWIRYYSRNPTSDRLDLKEQMTLEIGVANDWNDHIALMPSGNVGIGIADPQHKLHVSGNVQASNLQVTSSRTRKKNIRAIAGERAAAIVDALQPVSFEWKDGPTGEQLGFIAEDCPAEITTPARDSIALPHIVAALTGVVRAQTATIAALQDRLGRLEARA